DGSIDLNVWGGTPPYSYLWNDGAVSQDRTQLSSGNYAVTITDALGCTKVISKRIVQPAKLRVSTTQVDVACFGGAGGSFDINTRGGVAPYTFLWNDGVTAENRNSLLAGNYNLLVTDNNGCSKSINRSIKEPKKLNVGKAINNVNCFGGNDGQIDLNIVKGTKPYSVLWSDGSTNQTNANLLAGNYSVSITDANGCQLNRSYTVSEPSELTLSLSVLQAVSGYNINNASVEATASGGTPNYSYQWSNGTNNRVQLGLGAGAYSVLVTDANNCTAIETITLNQPDSLMVSTIHTDILCFGDQNGSVDVSSISGGVPPYQYFWSSGDTTPLVANLVPGTYNLFVTDANGNSAMSQETITQPAQISLSVTNTSVSCNGGMDGTIDLTVTGGVGPFGYVWSNMQGIQDPGAVSAGTYTVTVTDLYSGSSCNATISTTITEPSVLTGNISVSNTTCNSIADGSLDLSVNGGTMPYTYAWSNNEVTEDISGLAAGTYTVTVTDANGCTLELSETITQPAALQLSITNTPVTCNGGADGTIDLTVNGGVGPFGYVWSNQSTTEDLSSLTAGSYSVTVTDLHSGLNCNATISTMIIQPSAVDVQITASTNVTGNGLSNGTATAQASGGTIPYTYLWSDGQIGQNATNLPVGTYTVTATDANGCTDETTVIITEPDPLQITTDHVDVLCFGDATGSANVLTVTGGVAPYSYAWSNGGTNSTIDNLLAGIYTVIVTDANGNTVTSQEEIIEPLVALNAQIAGQNPSCSGASTGSAGVLASDGTGPYTYLWNNGQTSSVAMGLSAGTYSVIITDANGCTIEESTTIIDPAALSGNITSIDATCNGAIDGALNLSVNGGTMPYTYAWSSNEVTEDISGLGAGTYTVIITDANGCTLELTETITEPAAIQLSITNTPVTCNGGMDGTIDLTVTGGVGPFSYIWSNQQGIEDPSALSAGTYTVTVTDLHSGSSCNASISTTITEPTLVDVQITASTNVSGNGLSNGTATAQASGGIPTYTYVWSDGQTGSNAINLSAATYTVTATDANGCTDETTVIITEPNQLQITTDHVDVLCFGDASGSASVLTVIGGVAPYSYAWSNGSTNLTIDNLLAGTYTVVVTDANGNTASSQEVIIQPIVALNAQIAGQDVNCSGASTGSAGALATGGTSPYTYLWSDGQVGSMAMGLSAGTYSVVITDAHGCTLEKSITISEPTALNGSIAVTNATCNAALDGALNLSVNGGTMPYTYAWSNNEQTEDISGLAAGAYTVLITDANGCALELTESVTEPTALGGNIVVNNVTCNGALDGALDLTVNGGTSPYTYAWSNNAVSEDLSGIAGGTYTVVVFDANGCTLELTENVTEATALSGNIVANNVTCNGALDGALNLTVNGGTLPYTYAWSNNDITEDLSGIAGGTYTVVITDANGCTLELTESIVEPTALGGNVLASDVTCNDEQDGALNLTVNGGTLPYAYA
ncbi:MAG: hypothetical protein HKO56_06640, partial [Bacteroidia bacterium]|nr:hypothetical protein [Bacteroidia bacterium]